VRYGNIFVVSKQESGGGAFGPAVLKYNERSKEKGKILWKLIENIIAKFS
jgi:hypothetical protein